MKNIICFISLVLIMSCKVKKVNEQEMKEVELDAVSKILILQVDYETNAFEQVIELPLNSPILSGDSIPLERTYVSPSDFGSVTFHYKPSKELIFDGTIIWSGTGKRTYPVDFSSYSFYEKSSKELVLNPSKIQNYFNEDLKEMEKAWSAINNLRIVAEYFSSNKNIVFFLYTPSVGMGNPADWDWYIMMYK